CYYAGYDMFAIGLGQTVICGLTVDFYNPADGIPYRIIMNPGCPAFTDGCPEVNPTAVTCTGMDASGKCNQWTIGPSGNNNQSGVPANVIRLAKITTVKGRQVVENLGDFTMSFNIGITYP